jgi:hypothetical protein
MSTLPKKTPTEAKVVTFDFSSEAAVGATLSSPVVTKSLVAGTDTGAASLTVGVPAISGQTILVLVSAGTDANKYGLKCSVQASNGETHEIAAQMPVALDAI